MTSIKKHIKIDFRSILIIISVIVAYLIFWAHYPTYSFDSCWYISYLRHFIADKPMYEWDIIHGWSLPVVLYLAYLIKPGYIGVQVVFSIIYLLFCIYVFKTYDLFIKEKNKALDFIAIAVINILLIYSPILWGYAHHIFPEFMAAAVFVICAYYSYRAIVLNRDNSLSKKEIIKYNIIMCLLFLFAWFLKQSFAEFVLCMLFMIDAFLFIKNKKRIHILAFMLVIVVWLASVKIWAGIVAEKPDTSVEATTETTSSEKKDEKIVDINPLGVSARLRYFELESDDGNTIVNVLDDAGNPTDSFELSSSGLLFDCIKHAPKRLIRGFLDNYGVITNLYSIQATEGKPIEWIYGNGPVQKNGIGNVWNNRSITAENVLISYYHISQPRDYFEEINSRKENLVSRGVDISLVDDYGYVSEDNAILHLLAKTSLWVSATISFSLSNLLAPFIFLLFGVLFIVRRREEYLLMSMVGLSSFVFIVSYLYIGLPLDRYAVPTYAVMTLYVLCFLAYIISRCLAFVFGKNQGEK